MANQIYTYEIKFYDEGESKTRYGAVQAPTYAAAVELVSSWYGDEQIEELNISAISDCPVIVMSKASYYNIKEQNTY